MEVWNALEAPGSPSGHRSLVGAFAALAVTVLILLAAMAAGSVGGDLFDAMSGLDGPRSWQKGEREAWTAARFASLLLTIQVVIVVATVLASAIFARGKEQLLPLAPPSGGTRVLLGSALLLLVLSGVFAATIYYVDKPSLVSDVLPFVEILRSRTWWLMLVAAGLGAPIAEEFLFRGFLYGVLRRSPARRMGAALVSSLVWASLHANYSLYGMTAIFLIGLYLAWVRETTGSLVTPMVCHGLYNGLIVVVLTSVPDSFFQVI